MVADFDFGNHAMAVEVLLILSFELKIFIGYDPELFKLFIKTINNKQKNE